MPSQKQTKTILKNLINISTSNSLNSLLLFCLSSSITGCGQQHESSTFTINEDFQNYVSLFEQETEEKVRIDIDYNKLEYPIVGVCITYTNDYKEIQIDPDGWIQFDENYREELIFHELGHCILGRDHDSNLISSIRVPKSIMYPYIFGNAYSRYKNYYLDEIKNEQIDWTLYF